MTSAWTRLTGFSSEARASTGHFMLTLCTLAAPVSLRPPQAPQLKPFKFFMSRAHLPDGSERLYLHMGYFETLADAERWAASVRRHYPSAYATIAPLELLRQSNAKAPSLPSGASLPVLPTSVEPAAIKLDSLTDTQVIRILETRRGSVVQGNPGERNCDQIALLGPDDTGTRQALKEAVVQGAPVSFAVQLHWAAQRIDLSRVRSHAIFKAYTLYATESRRKEHVRHFLRLGFFADPTSAKQVAVQVRSIFASAVVVPVLEPEITRVREARSGGTAVPYLTEGPNEREVDSSGTPESPAEAKPLSDVLRRVFSGAGTKKPLRAPPAARELWTEPDPLSESGVRHLRVNAQDPLSGRWRRIHLGSEPPDLA